MLQNKIYQNFIVEIIRTLLIILFVLSLVALTVRAVNFLDLIVENGYNVSTYFKYSFLNIFGLAPKFIPLSFLIALLIFIIRHKNDSEFVILWTSGVKKIQLVNIIFLTSLIVSVFYLIFSTYVTPLALNKSRQILSNSDFNSFLPTIRTQQFSDSFKGFTFIVEKKQDNKLQNIFLHDKGDNLKNLSSNTSEISETTITAENGLLEEKKMYLFNGQIISSKKNTENEIIKFEQLTIDLSNLVTTTIKKPKIQETPTHKLLGCIFKDTNEETRICNEEFKTEILPVLNRRMVTPFYIPVISLICALLLIKTKRFYLNKVSVFLYGFSLLLFTELAIRYTGISFMILTIYIILPFLFFLILYFFLVFQFSIENKVYE
tara:strand:- start:227 stop:1354 length:1128 start_codon:yes stop_codon:yes gene_type:complete